VLIGGSGDLVGVPGRALRFAASNMSNFSTSQRGTGGRFEETCRLFLGGGISRRGLGACGFFLEISIPRITP